MGSSFLLIRWGFFCRTRGDAKFDDLEGLKAQLAQDERETRAALGL